MQPVDEAVTALRDLLLPFRPAPVIGLPQPSLGLADLSPRPVLLGGRRGLGGVTFAAEVRAVQIEALASYQVWALDPAGVDAALIDLTRTLLSEAESLRTRDLIRIRSTGTSAAGPLPDGSGWGGRAEFAVLFEYLYEDPDDALGLIASIPVSTAIGTDDPDAELITLTDHMIRWDGVSAPALVVRGPGSVHRLNLLVHAPGAGPAGPVRLLRTRDGDPPPGAETSLPAFLAAVSGPDPARRGASFSFPNLAAALAAATADGDPVVLGQPPAAYTARSLALDPGLVLPTAQDRFEISFPAGPLDLLDIAYLTAR